MVSRLRTAAAVVVLCVIGVTSLTACTGDPDLTPDPATGSTSDPSASPTPGTLVGLDPFAVTLPEGWTQQPDGAGALLLGISNTVVDDYPMNVHIVEDSTLAQVAPEQLEATRDAVLTAPGPTAFTQVTSEGDYEVDGEQGVRLTYETTIRGIAVRSDEVSVTHGDTGYIATFSFAPSVSKTDRDIALNTIMDTWTWAQ